MAELTGYFLDENLRQLAGDNADQLEALRSHPFCHILIPSALAVVRAGEKNFSDAAERERWFNEMTHHAAARLVAHYAARYVDVTSATEPFAREALARLIAALSLHLTWQSLTADETKHIEAWLAVAKQRQPRLAAAYVASRERGIMSIMTALVVWWGRTGGKVPTWLITPSGSQ